MGERKMHTVVAVISSTSSVISTTVIDDDDDDPPPPSLTTPGIRHVFTTTAAAVTTDVYTRKRIKELRQSNEKKKIQNGNVINYSYVRTRENVFIFFALSNRTTRTRRPGRTQRGAR